MKRILKAIWRGWKAFAHKLGVLNTKIILTILYFIVIGTAAMIAKILRRDLLDRRLCDEDSFWKARESLPVNLENARRQF